MTTVHATTATQKTVDGPSGKVSIKLNPNHIWGGGASWAMRRKIKGKVSIQNLKKLNFYTNK